MWDFIVLFAFFFDLNTFFPSLQHQLLVSSIYIVQHFLHLLSEQHENQGLLVEEKVFFLKIVIDVANRCV